MSAEIASLPEQAYVYVIGPSVGPQKIGIATKPEERLAMLQTGNHFDLRVHSAAGVSRAAARDVETYAHWLLAENRIRGEWFDVTAEHAAQAVTDAIAAVASGLKVPKPEAPSSNLKPLSSDEYRETLKRLGLTQVGAADFLGVNGVTSRRWATGKADIPQATAMLLRLMLAMKLSPEKVKEWLAEG